MSKPTENDWESFRQVPRQTKAKILEAYLYGIPDRKGKSNMEMVADYVFGKTTQSEMQFISCITRCYGFEGQNGSYYKKAKLNLVSDDFVQFVKKYPNGCPDDYPEHKIMDEFMEDRSVARNCKSEIKSNDKQNMRDEFSDKDSDGTAIDIRKGLKSINLDGATATIGKILATINNIIHKFMRNGNVARNCKSGIESNDKQNTHEAFSNRDFARILISLLVIIDLFLFGNPKAVSGWTFYVVVAIIISLIVKIIRRITNQQRRGGKMPLENILSGIAWFAFFFHSSYYFFEASKSTVLVLLTLVAGAVGGIILAVKKKR